MLQLLVNMIMPHNVPASCIFTGSDVLLIRILAKFDFDLFCVPFLNFQSNSKSNDLVNVIPPQKLHVQCCSFTGIFFT